MPVARSAQTLAEFELHAFAGAAPVADIVGVPARESMPLHLAGKPQLCKRSSYLRLQHFVQAAEQHVGSGRRISMHRNHAVAVRNEGERTRLVEPVAREVQANEIVAARPQPLEKVQPVLIARDQPRDLRGASFDAAAVGCENRRPGTLRGHDVHGIVDAFRVAMRKILVAAKIIGGNRLTHRTSLTQPAPDEQPPRTRRRANAADTRPANPKAAAATLRIVLALKIH
jgi:hypothetical protein